MHRRLPEVPTVSTPETYAQHGLRVLRFIIETRITATVSTDDLDCADSTYPIAVCAPELSVLVLDTLADVRRQIQRALIARRALTVTDPATVHVPQVPVAPPGGERVLATVAPKINPRGPVGTAADVERFF